VIRFDNRDIGLSGKLHGAPRVNLPMALLRSFLGLKIHAPYRIDDMADDAIGLLDALGIRKAHIVGASLGGMIAQSAAARHTERTRSLVSLMSTSGDPRLPKAKPRAAATLLARRPPKGDREASIEFGVRVLKTISSPGYPPDEDDLRARVAAAFDRAYYPAGVARQLLAIMASGSRVEMLKTIRVPTLVLHGADDPLVPVEGGKSTAALIPGAELEIISGWGHDLPAALLPRLAERIADHCRKADQANA
jgi:pimeloyl-ACP methyl ester carboxylesterase